jgi:hypothetical protein
MFSLKYTKMPASLLIQPLAQPMVRSIVKDARQGRHQGLTATLSGETS